MTARSLDEHRELVARALPRMPALDVALDDALGGMLAQDVVADHSVPATGVASTDGYVLRAVDAAGARADKPVVLPVTHDVTFDSRGKRRHVPKTSARILSGAPVPDGADAVVALADTDAGVAQVAITTTVAAGDNVRPEGFDAKIGDTVLRAGTRVGARHVAMAAAIGVARLPVHPVPRVVVIAVGDELVEPGATRPGGGVHETTGHLVANLVRDAGARAYRVGAVADDRTALRGILEDQLVRADVIIVTGGLSGGRNDTVAEVLALMGSLDGAAVRLTPGGHHGIGRIVVGRRDVPVIALPGRPVAAVVAFESYVRDALRAMSGHGSDGRDLVAAAATTAWQSPTGVAHAVPVMLEAGGSVGAKVTPVGNPQAPSLADFAKANGLVLLPEDVTEVRAGTVLRCIAWDT